MTHRPPPPNPPPPSGAAWRTWLRAGGWWYVLLTIATAGLGAWIPFLHAGRRLNDAALKRRAAYYGGIAAVILVLLMIIPSAGQEDPTALEAVPGLAMMSLMAVGVVQQWRLRHPLHAAAQSASRAQEPAVAGVLAARQRRDEARALAADDPLMARELHIGRPDLHRTYDDGGLVDLNTAPADVIAHVCDLDPTSAQAVVAARGTHGFTTVDEVFVRAETIPVTSWDRIRDRALIIQR